MNTHALNAQTLELLKQFPNTEPMPALFLGHGSPMYAITDTGRAHLAENRPAVDELFDRVGQIGDAVFGDTVRPARDAMIGLAREFGTAMMNGRRTPEQIAVIAEILNRAAADIKRASA